MSGFIAGAIVVGAVVGAYAANQAAKKSAAAQEEAARIQARQQQKALEAQQAAYEPFKPYLMGSLQRYQGLLEKPGSVKQQPGYMFRLQQGLEAAGIPANGRFLSGAQIRSATQYGQQYASNEYQNALNQAAGLGSLAQGNYQPAAQNAAALGNIYGNIGQIQAQGVLGAGQARAAGTLGMANAFNQGLQNYQLYRMYNQQPQTTGVGGSVSGNNAGATGGYYSSDYVAPGGSFGNTNDYGAYSGLTAYGEPEYG